MNIVGRAGIDGNFLEPELGWGHMKELPNPSVEHSVRGASGIGRGRVRHAVKYAAGRERWGGVPDGVGARVVDV